MSHNTTWAGYNCDTCGKALPAKDRENPSERSPHRDLDDHGWVILCHDVDEEKYICHQCNDHRDVPVKITASKASQEDKTMYDSFYGQGCHYDCGRKLPMVNGTKTASESAKAAGWVWISDNSYSCRSCFDKHQAKNDKPKGDIYACVGVLRSVCRCGTYYDAPKMSLSMREFQKHLVSQGWLEEDQHGWSCPQCLKKRHEARTTVEHAVLCSLRAAEYVAKQLLDPEYDHTKKPTAGEQMFEALKKAGADDLQIGHVNTLCCHYVSTLKNHIALQGQQHTVPRFVHECRNGCKFLGQYDEYDLYYCPQSGIPTVIARYGDDDPEYQSGIGFKGMPALQEAESRARIMGFLPVPKMHTGGKDGH